MGQADVQLELKHVRNHLEYYRVRRTNEDGAILWTFIAPDSARRVVLDFWVWASSFATDTGALTAGFSMGEPGAANEVQKFRAAYAMTRVVTSEAGDWLFTLNAPDVQRMRSVPPIWGPEDHGFLRCWEQDSNGTPTVDFNVGLVAAVLPEGA